MSRLERLRLASEVYFARFRRGSLGAEDLTPELVARIMAERSSIRAAEGGGGMCHLVTEWLLHEYGSERMSVTYLDRSGDVICAGHLVAILADGSILDPTADQMGEGHDVRILRVGDEEYGRYRPEFDDDYHPGHPDVGPALDAWKELVSGSVDCDVQEELRGERGHGWWVEDGTLLRRYYLEQADLARADPYDGGKYASLMERWAAEVTDGAWHAVARRP